MDITINNQYDNILLQRNEVTATMLFEGATPDRKQVQQAIAAQTKAKEKLVIITNINTSFGNSKAEVSAHIYKDEAIMFRNERKNLIEKHKGHDPEEIKAAEEAAKKAAEEKAAKEAPAEQTTDSQTADDAEAK
jgi:small subunit ribosomal protein S24e